MQNKRRDGRAFDYTATADVKGGDLIVLAALVGVAATDIPAGEERSCEAVGVFDLPKTTASEAFVQGAAVFAAPGEKATVSATDAGSDVRVGVVWIAAASADETVAVKINV